MCRILFRAEGVHGQGIAAYERDALLDQVPGRVPAEARPVLEEACAFGTETPIPVPTVAYEDSISFLYRAVLLLPLPYMRGGKEAAGRKFQSLYRRGASGEAVEGDLVYTVVSGAFGDKVQGASM